MALQLVCWAQQQTAARQQKASNCCVFAFSLQAAVIQAQQQLAADKILKWQGRSHARHLAVADVERLSVAFSLQTAVIQAHQQLAADIILN